MANKEFVYTITINDDGVEKTVQKTAKSINDYEEGIAGLKKQLQETDLGSDEFKKLNKDLQKAEKQFEKAKIKSQGLGESLSSIGGPIGGVIQGIKGFGQALKVLAMNPVGAVITAIVVAVTTLYKAFASTKKGAEMIDRVMAGFGATLDVLRDRVLELFSSWDNFKKIFTLDFWRDTANEIANEANQAMKLTGELQRLKDEQRDLNTERAKQNLLIADAKLRINDENLSYEERTAALEEVRQQEIALAKQEELLAKNRYESMRALQALSDSSAEDLDELAAAEQEYYNKQLASKQKQKELFDQEKALRDRQKAEQKARAQEREQELQKLADFEQQLMLDLIEDEDEKARAMLEIQRDADMEAIDNLKTTEAHKEQLREQAQQKYLNSVNMLEEAITKKEADEQQKREDQKKADEKEKIATMQRELAARIGLQNIANEEDLAMLQNYLNQQMNLELLNEELTESERAAIFEKYTKAMQDAEQALFDKTKDLEMRKRALLFEGLDAVITIAGEGTKVGKSAAYAKALINTYLGVSEVLKQESALPSPFDVIAKIVNTATIVGAGLQAARQIKSIPPPELAEGGLIKGPGTSTSDSIPARLSNGESVINANSTKMFLPLLSALNQAGGGRPFDGDMGGAKPSSANETPVIKTYVVASDVSNQQALDRQVKSRSII